MQWMMGFQTIWILNLISLQNSWPSTLISIWRSLLAKQEFLMKTWLELLTRFWFFLELWRPKISLKNFTKEDYADDFFWKNQLHKILRKWWFWSSKQNVAINSLQKSRECWKTLRAAITLWKNTWLSEVTQSEHRVLMSIFTFWAPTAGLYLKASNAKCPRYSTHVKKILNSITSPEIKANASSFAFRCVPAWWRLKSTPKRPSYLT